MSGLWIPDPLSSRALDLPIARIGGPGTEPPWPSLPRKLRIADLERLVLVVDMSLSTMRTDPLGWRFRGAAGVVKALARTHKDADVAVVTFDWGAEVALEPTRTRAAVAAVDGLRELPPGGGTAFGPASAEASRLAAGRRAAVVWLTDQEAPLPDPALDALSARVPSVVVVLGDGRPGWPEMTSVPVESLDGTQGVAEAMVDGLRTAVGAK